MIGPDGLGWWKVTLEAQSAGGPFDIAALSKVGNTSLAITLHDVLFGDVWLCSGQSNMQFTVSQVMTIVVLYLIHSCYACVISLPGNDCCSAIHAFNKSGRHLECLMNDVIRGTISSAIIEL